jgi:hypothetical protein
MATVVNDRDVLIMSATPRFAAATDRAFFVNPESAIFKVTNGIASPSSFNFTPTLLNMSGTVSYVPSAGLAIAVNGNNFSLAYSDMTVAAGTVVATLVVDGVTYTRTIPVSRIVDGVAPKILDLGASSQVFKIDKAGVGSPGSIELIAYGQNLAGTPNFTITAGTATLAIGSDNTRKQLTFANMATDLVQVTVTQDGQTDTMTIVKVREGTDGVSGVTGFLTNESQTVPANLDGSTISMAGATTTMKVFVGAADDSANWAYTASPASAASAITYTLGATNGVLTASAMNAGVDAAYVDINATRQGFASITKRFSIAKSKTGPMGQTGQTGLAGARGNVNLSVVTSGSIWSDAEANAAVVNMTGTSARARDVVNLYRADRTWAQKRIFDGFNWSILADVFDGSIFVKGSVISDALATGAVTARTLAAGAVTATSVAVGSPDNLIPDPDINDLAWWGLDGLATAVDYGAANVGWKSRRALHFQNRPFIDVLSKEFSITPSTDYYAEYQSYLSPDFIGNISVYLYLSGYMWNDMGGPSRGYNWGETGLQMDFDGNSPKGFSTWGKAFVNGPTTIQSKALIRITVQVSAGYAEIGGMSVTRRSGGVLISDKGIKANHIEVDTLQAISNVVIARPGGQGAGVDLDINGSRTYDPNSVRRFQWGNLDV